jgi:hypothetical protein
MKQTPLRRLATLARKKKDFFKLLHDDRKAALTEAAKRGIVLSPAEKIMLGKLLTGRQVRLDLTDLGVQARGKPKPIFFWDILCDLIGYKGARKSAGPKR